MCKTQQNITGWSTALKIDSICATACIVGILVLFALPVTVCAEEFLVSNVSEFDQAVNNVQPGDVIVMENGTWEDANLNFEAQGTESEPITLKAETPDSVILTGQSTLQIAGDYLVVDGLIFKDGYINDFHVIEFRESSSNLSNHCRLTNCAIINYNPSSDSDRYMWVSLYGTNNRIDHCYFSNMTHSGLMVCVWLEEGNNDPVYHRIDNNIFEHRPEGSGNGYETIRIGDSATSMCNARVRVEHNYFYKCDGEIEIISNKSCENIYRYNTFDSCSGQLTLRHGKRCLVEGNFFLGNGVSESSGVRIIDEDHVVVNNYFSNLTGEGYRASIAMMNGIPDSELNEYFQVKNALVAYNTFVDCYRPFEIGVGSSSSQSLEPSDCIIANNIVRSNGGGDMISYQDTPTNMTYDTNMMYGADLGISSNDGIIQEDPDLVLNEYDVFVPSSDSPAKNIATNFYLSRIEGAGGQTNSDEMYDLGIYDVYTEKGQNRPLSKGVVGPFWMQNVVQPTATSTPTATPTPTPEEVSEPTLTPTPISEPEPAATNTPEPTATNTPTPEPSADPNKTTGEICVNAKDFGAKGDGSTIDQYAIQAAIDHIAGNGEGIVCLDPGVYLLEGTSNPDNGCIVLKNNVSLVGTGIGTTVLRYKDQANNSINGIVRTTVSNDNNNSYIQDLTIDGNMSNQSSGDVIGLYCNGSGGTKWIFRCEDVEVKNCSVYGFALDDTSFNLTLNSCQSHDNGVDGFAVGGCDNTTLIHCESWGNTRHGINVYSQSSNISIMDCRSYDNGDNGVTVQHEGQSINIQDSQLNSNHKSGIYLRGSSDIFVEGNSIRTNVKRGIRLRGSSYVEILGNHLLNNATGGSDCEDILLEDYDGFGSSNCTVMHNLIYAKSDNRTSWGISESGNLTNDNIFTMNRIEGQSQGAINMTGSNSSTSFN